MPEILTSLHGRRLGLGHRGNLLAMPDSAAEPKPVPLTHTLLATAGAALGNSTAETVLASGTILKNSLIAGQLIQCRFQGIVTAANSTDTLTVRLRIGGVAGIALIAMVATDATANDVFTGEFELAVRSIGAAGTMAGVGTFKSIPAAEGTMTIRDDILSSTALDTTADQQVCVTGQWSVANAGNSCRVDFFRLTLG
jgi:hypothetical protein